MPIVRGAPHFPFYMPRSVPVDGGMDEILRQRAIELTRRGYQAGINVDGGDAYLGRTLEMGDLYYQHPNVPGYHFQQQFVEGDSRPPQMMPGSLDQMIALELAKREAGYDRYDPFDREAPGELPRAAAAYEQVLDQAQRRGGAPRRTRAEAQSTAGNARMLEEVGRSAERLARIMHITSRYDV